MARGPCNLCGAVGYAASMGGDFICPSCDVGKPPRPDLYECHKGISMDQAKDALIDALRENAALRDEVSKLRAIPAAGTFHHRLGVEGLFGVMERMAICRLLKDHIEGKPVVDRTEDETAREEFNYDITFPCACCGKKSTNYLCGKCCKDSKVKAG